MLSIWILLLIIFVAGAIGGTINALMTDNGFALPKTLDGIVRPGWLGNALIGGVAAAVSWTLYGSMAGVSIFSDSAENLQKQQGLTLAALGGAILVGVAGARWLSNEVDKSLLRVAGANAAKAKPEAENDLLKAFAVGTPAAALQASQGVAEDEGPDLRRQ